MSTKILRLAQFLLNGVKYILGSVYLVIQVHGYKEGIFVMVSLKLSLLGLQGKRLDFGFAEGAEAMVGDDGLGKDAEPKAMP